MFIRCSQDAVAQVGLTRLHADKDTIVVKDGAVEHARDEAAGEQEEVATPRVDGGKQVCRREDAAFHNGFGVLTSREERVTLSHCGWQRRYENL